MQNEKRYLQKQPSYYEYAMQQANVLDILNQNTLPEDFHLQIFWCRYIHYSSQLKIRPNSRLHSHSFFELHCILNGSLQYHEEEQEPTDVSAGNYILIAPKQNHYLKALTPDAETFAVTFEPVCRDTAQGRRLNARFDSITTLKAALPSDIFPLIEQIMQEFHDGKSFCTQNVKLLLNILTINLIRSVFEEYPDERKQSADKSATLKDARLIDLEKYIADNPSRVFSVAELAEHLNISSRQLNNIIGNDLSISAKEFIDIRKAKQARRLLLETDFKLQQISEMLGFSDHNNFNRFFKRLEGMSPGRFREAKKNYFESSKSAVTK
ncbi:MAG: helix-turn-helix transcriptional regulator [Clostridia bacterium]|nr:helix-turn-helix transcriptional regulator [Clostridia bacterium]